MLHTILRLIAALVLPLPLAGCIDAAHADPPAEAAALEYPATKQVDQVDVYHGESVADPYRWLEKDTSETRAWIDTQVELFDGYVGGSDSLEALSKRIREIRDFDGYSVPVRRGDRYFFTHNPAGRNHGRLHVQTGLNGKSRVLLDFAEAVEDETHGTGGFAPSHDGRHVVWSSQSPTRWGWLDIVDIDGKSRPAERIHGIASSGVLWTHDNESFFYQQYGDYEALIAGTVDPRPRIMYHRLGTSETEDREVYSREDRPSMLFSPRLSDDGRYLVIELYDGTSKKNQVIYRDLRKDDGELAQPRGGRLLPADVDRGGRRGCDDRPDARLQVHGPRCRRSTTATRRVC
jgi:prolyl oligopeptidase